MWVYWVLLCLSSHMDNKPNYHLWQPSWSLSTHTHWRHPAIADKVLGNHWQHVHTHHHSSRQWHLLSRPVNKQVGRPLQIHQLMEQQLPHHKLATQCTVRLQSPPWPQTGREHTHTHTHTDQDAVQLDQQWCHLDPVLTQHFPGSYSFTK